jgi:NADH-quinone oxidoreductase chain G
MIELIIDNKKVQVLSGSTVLQACREVGVEIPRFCYHERLSIAGNCRMCLVEIEKSAKPIASCAMPVMNNMVIYTNSPVIKKAREGIMEFLLVNHPLDCPICDQGGECDLQDQAMIFGSDRGRYFEYKRAVEDKDFGPLVKTIMTRCIHCTRCVRFASEIAGVPDLGTSGRGNNMEIGSYIEKTFKSELSGNVIDLCPVGALTSKPYAFTARSWELKSVESIDVSDSLGSNISIDSRGSEIMRVLPRLNEEVNEEWISDKARFSYDGLKRQRLNVPMIRQKGKLNKSSWKEAFTFIKDRIKKTDGKNIGGVIGKLVDLESTLALRDLLNNLNSQNYTCFEDSYPIQSSVINYTQYLFNTPLHRLEEVDVCLIIGSNVRKEAPLLNTRLRKAYQKNDMIAGVIGLPMDLTYPIEHISNNPQILYDLSSGKHPFMKILKQAKKPAIIIGKSIWTRDDYKSILSEVSLIYQNLKINKSDWNGWNILHSAASHPGCLSIGLLEESNNKFNSIGPRDVLPFEIIYSLGSDDLSLNRISNQTFLIYQGHHGDKLAHRADVILPGSAFTEKNGLYMNLEGRVQQTKLVQVSPGDSREDWKILRALSEILNIPLSYNSLDELRLKIIEINPIYNHVDILLNNNNSHNHNLFHKSGELSIERNPFQPIINNFYMTDSITRSSKIMLDCSKAFNSNSNYLVY